jgi:hypothetical protein
MHPQLAAGRAVEGVEPGLESGGGLDIRTRDDAIGCDEDIAMTKVFRRSPADVRLSLHLARPGVELTKRAIARSHVDAVARDRGRVRESAASFKLPQDL